MQTCMCSRFSIDAPSSGLGRGSVTIKRLRRLVCAQSDLLECLTQIDEQMKVVFHIGEATVDRRSGVCRSADASPMSNYKAILLMLSPAAKPCS